VAHAAYAQLPDEVRAAGITVAQWTVVQVQVQRYAADKHVSERALSAVCAKMGIELARGRHFDLDQLVGLSRAKPTRFAPSINSSRWRQNRTALSPPTC
jgi:hypothetical protein